jgi:hypothetical protein
LDQGTSLWLSVSGIGSVSSSVSSSAELQAENWLCIGARMGGMSITFGASSGRRTTLFGDCSGVCDRKDRSGHEHGEIGPLPGVYVGIFLS